MRYVIQVVVMITEVAIPVLAVWTVLSYPTSIICWAIAVLCVYDICKDGGPLRSWHPANAKKFLENAKKIGL